MYGNKLKQHISKDWERMKLAARQFYGSTTTCLCGSSLMSNTFNKTLLKAQALLKH